MEDFSFGNVWGDDSSPKPAVSKLPEISAPKSFTAVTEDAFDDDDDDFGDEFSAPVQVTNNDQADDDFGDFGDFGDASEAQQTTGTFDDGFGDEDNFVGGNAIRFQQQQYLDTWQPIRLDPLPNLKELQTQLDKILAPLWYDVHPEQLFSGESIRQVEGVGQVLVTQESRSLYTALLESPPPQSRPPNWTRSRIRRQHLISLGIPVNLDEVLPQAAGKPMPALHISTRPSSAPPTPRPAQANIALSTGSATRSSTPKPDRSSASKKNGPGDLGPRPTLDQAKIDQMLSLTPGKLMLVSIRLKPNVSTLQKTSLFYPYLPLTPILQLSAISP
ncbi:hypothetical protein FRC02_004188 [Tulasnella sp. 418]|nr:hypothetical protein FRC02_004188 [Tulasnella sp. 418]